LMSSIQPLTFKVELRERAFGAEYEGKSSDLYGEIWEADLKALPYEKYSLNAKNRNGGRKVSGSDEDFRGVESVNSVQERAVDLIKYLDTAYSGLRIILVCHGDVCQILQTHFAKIEPSQHRTLKHMENAELRELVYAA
jgi:broad specificity phosphatase PhoE